jgi:hypothetical protein
MMPLMKETRTPSSRTLTVVLSENEWRAFRNVEPDAVGWLQERIRERLVSAGQPDAKANSTFPSTVSAGACWGDDEY